MIKSVFSYLNKVNRYETVVSFRRGGVNDRHRGTVVVMTDPLSSPLTLLRKGRWVELGIAVETTERWVLQDHQLIFHRPVAPGHQYDELFRFDVKLSSLARYYCAPDCYSVDLFWLAGSLVCAVKVNGPNKEGAIVTTYFK